MSNAEMPTSETFMKQPNVFVRVYENAREAWLPIALTVGLGVGAVACGNSGNEVVAISNDPDRTELTLPEFDVSCPETWQIVQTSNAKNRVIPDGVDAIATAVSEEDAREAMDEVMTLIKPDPDKLVGYYAAFLKKTVSAEDLVDETGQCATSLAEQVFSEIEGYLLMSKITPDEAPANGVNSGMNANGEFAFATNSGISGDLTALKVEGPDGEETWVLERCGNPVKIQPKDASLDQWNNQASPNVAPGSGGQSGPPGTLAPLPQQPTPEGTTTTTITAPGSGGDPAGECGAACE